MTADPTPRTVADPAVPHDATASRRPARRLTKGVAVLAVGALVFLSGCLNTNQNAGLSHTNDSRRAHGLRSVGIVGDAQTKAQRWADHMAAAGRISHSTLTSGITSRWCALGENVGVGPTVRDVHAAFMRSAPHRANILGNYNAMGVGVAVRGGQKYVAYVFIRTC